MSTWYFPHNLPWGFSNKYSCLAVLPAKQTVINPSKSFITINYLVAHTNYRVPTVSNLTIFSSLAEAFEPPRASSNEETHLNFLDEHVAKDTGLHVHLNGSCMCLFRIRFHQNRNQIGFS